IFVQFDRVCSNGEFVSLKGNDGRPERRHVFVEFRVWHFSNKFDIGETVESKNSFVLDPANQKKLPLRVATGSQLHCIHVEPEIECANISDRYRIGGGKPGSLSISLALPEQRFIDGVADNDRFYFEL